MMPIPFAKRFDGITGSAIREILRLTSKPGMISFSGGNPSPAALREDVVLEYTQKALLRDGKNILQYGATEGYAPFLDSLERYLSEHLTLQASRKEILPVAGSSQAMDLLLKALIDPGDTILVENPTFLGNIQCMRLYQANIVPIESDAHGVIADDLEVAVRKYHPKMVYVIPTFQNPTGCTLALDRRKRLAEMASEYQFILAEDDPYRDLRYTGQTLPAIKTFDTTGHTAYLGSFSKIISPGIRVGYLTANEAIIRKCIIGKQSADVHAPNITQAIVDLYLRENALPEHINTICGAYRLQLDAMLQELSHFPAGTRYTVPEGGLFIFVTLPNGLDAQTLLKTCIERNVAFVPGTPFYPDGGHYDTMRLNFSNSTVDTIHTGMQILKQAIIDLGGY